MTETCKGATDAKLTSVLPVFHDAHAHAQEGKKLGSPGDPSGELPSGRASRWCKRCSRLPQSWPRIHSQEHPSFKRNKMTLLTMGIAVVLVANVTFLGYLTPPQAPPTPLLAFNLPYNHKLDGQANNGFINFLLNKTSVQSNGTLDFGSIDYQNLSVADYASIFTSVQQTDYCDYSLSTAFNVFNGLAFSFAVATLFLVAIVPVFIRRQHWDQYMAKVGAICMVMTLTFFVVAFVLAGFVTVGVGQGSPTECLSSAIGALQDGVNKGATTDKTNIVQSASAYVTLGMVCLLIGIVILFSLKETHLAPGAAHSNCLPPQEQDEDDMV